MNILFAASEAAPFAKTGGLADVAGSLPSALSALGHDVRLVMPRYQHVDTARFDLTHAATFHVPLGSWNERCDILQGRMGRNIIVYFVNKDRYYDRPGLYGTPRGDYPDNDERFIFFSRAALELCRALGFHPDIIHCNDWQTGLVPLYLKKRYAGTAPFEKTRSIFTIHNLGYQGLFPPETMGLIGMAGDVFTPEGMEFWGKASFLKAGLVYSDLITTVSDNYSREIQSKEYGYGLEGVLSRRAGDLSGILNGIDYRAWDPAGDRAIEKNYSASQLDGKSVCRKALLASAGFTRKNAPLIGMVTRFTEQKGLDLLIDALPGILSLGVQLVILGTGEEQYHRLLAVVSRRYSRQVRILFGFDETRARRIYSGSDLFLMPSRYEPCGLGQMIALRYGAVPVVRRTGGLVDTVIDHDDRRGGGTGFVFDQYAAEDLIACLKRALIVLRDQKKWNSLVQNGMKQDFSWEHSAKEYERLYRKAVQRQESEERSKERDSKNRNIRLTV